MVEGIDFAFLNGVFGYFHETVDFLNVNVFDVVAPGLYSLLNNFRHAKIVNYVVCTKL